MNGLPTRRKKGGGTFPSPASAFKKAQDKTPVQAQLEKLQLESQREALELTFWAGWQGLKPLDLPNPICKPNDGIQLRFNREPNDLSRSILGKAISNHAFDFAWLEPYKVAVEVEGGTWTGGRHVRGQGYEEDCKKYNLAAAQGWIIIRLTGRMVTHELPIHMEPLILLLRQRALDARRLEAGFALEEKFNLIKANITEFGMNADQSDMQAYRLLQTYFEKGQA